MWFESDAYGRFLRMSKNVREFYGYDPYQLVGKSGWDRVHPDDLFAPVLHGVRTFRVKRADGTYVKICCQWTKVGDNFYFWETPLMNLDPKEQQYYFKFIAERISEISVPFRNLEESVNRLNAMTFYREGKLHATSALMGLRALKTSIQNVSDAFQLVRNRQRPLPQMQPDVRLPWTSFDQLPTQARVLLDEDMKRFLAKLVNIPIGAKTNAHKAIQNRKKRKTERKNTCVVHATPIPAQMATNNLLLGKAEPVVKHISDISREITLVPMHGRASTRKFGKLESKRRKRKLSFVPQSTNNISSLGNATASSPFGVPHDSSSSSEFSLNKSLSSPEATSNSIFSKAPMTFKKKSSSRPNMNDTQVRQVGKSAEVPSVTSLRQSVRNNLLERSNSSNIFPSQPSGPLKNQEIGNLLIENLN
eukprot:CAMPEP_0167755834 /NCGR_PEP_ID=MMETSP0110_2-20121227/9043_1 /TAXON_ID=629695 /ORGANISM="Gymnochlora sp., Strain CCMP2014" /LENGTH=418 /DNA_ID=CAMNT_0007641863 /DNA_START=30 /DNA_END=1286 /DNA_ORIENTATION=+